MGNMFYNYKDKFSDKLSSEVLDRLYNLDGADAYSLYMIFEYSYDKNIKNIVLYFIKNDLVDRKFLDNIRSDEYKGKLLENYLYNKLYEYMSSLDIDINSYRDILIDIPNYDFDYSYNTGIDISFIFEVIMLQGLIKNKKVNINDDMIKDRIKELSEYIYGVYKKKLDNEYGNSDYIKNSFNNVIYYLISGELSYGDFDYCFGYRKSLERCLLYAKYSNIFKEYTKYINYEKIPLEVINLMSSKQVRILMERFIRVLDGIRLDDGMKSKIPNFILNLYISIGYDRSINIINNLGNDKDLVKDRVRKLLFAFENIDFSNLKVDGNNFVRNDFGDLIVGDNVNEPSNLLHYIYKGDVRIINNLSLIYNSMDTLNKRFNNYSVLTKTGVLLNVLKGTKAILDPDEYLLEGDIVNGYIDNRQYQALTENECIEALRKDYKKNRHNFIKSIPSVSGVVGNYSYEVLKANDPTIYNLGNITSCCFKLGGTADGFVKYISGNKNGRVVVIRKNGRIIAMAPIIRNGNIIFANSLEISRSSGYDRECFKVLEIVAKDIINVSSSCEKEDTAIVAFTIGNYKNKLDKYGDYKKVNNELDDIYYPVDEFVGYINTRDASNGIYILGIKDGKSEDDFRSFNPDKEYYDDRELPIKGDLTDDRIVKRVQAIYYENNGKVINLDPMRVKDLMVGDDWFIMIDIDNEIISARVGNDPRGMKEYNTYLDYYGTEYRNLHSTGYKK